VFDTQLSPVLCLPAIVKDWGGGYITGMKNREARSCDGV
jgi:hypothetical protein